MISPEQWLKEWCGEYIFTVYQVVDILDDGSEEVVKTFSNYDKALSFKGNGRESLHRYIKHITVY